ncbi:protein GAMETE EXPRESSED 2-like isoform X6 [Manihot esculenta]|uniref:protein GAMETE EXPRESSED 2-like isoform X6 n=1 Tax=Manihot esculenta TaxID=3983 RepID=UPI001CC71CED|nr:protein GAMETE EXPRESSED 2-like isoform X6 [Manihot esculenta]
MAIRYLIRILGFFSLFFPAFESSTSDKAKVPNFAFSWLNDNNTFQAGDTAAIKIIVLGEFDSKGNASLDKNAFNPTLTVNGKKGNSSFVSGVFLDTSGDTSTWRITFAPIRVGVFNVFINDDPFKVFDSSLHYEALPGKIYPSVCIALWMGFLNEFEAGERATIFILPRDAFGNDVSSTGEELNSYNFTVSVLYANGSLANVPNITHVGWNELGIISIEFIAEKAGDLLLHVKGGKQTLNGSPLPLKVNPGYCDGSASIVNGSGLNDSIAGEISQFSVYLFDIFQYPAFVELGSIKVQIVRENDSYYVQPSIVPIINGNGPAQELSHTEISPAPSDVTMNISAGHFEVAASVFHVTYTAEKSGIYEIYVFCGNILLSGVQSFRKEVKAGKVDVSLSKVVKFSPKVPKLIENEMWVQLMDSFSNHVLSQQSLLKLEIAVNRSGFSTEMFVDNNDGSYTCQYMAKDVGTYEMCVSFDGLHLMPCPFGVNVYGGEYFPKAYDDKISVWEDESIAFDVLANDYFAGHNASIVEFSKPNCGSLLQDGQFFRYTPYQNYYGNDSFMYTISDVNGNLAFATVSIDVLNIPPQFISFPSQLQATEDMISPRYGGFSGFEIRSSDPMENISVTLRADFGTLFLSPLLMQFWDPIWGKFLVKREDDEAKSLTLEGCVDVMNLALQSIQYLGNVNFSGNDTVRFSANNKNGINEIAVPAFVQSINDPPFINVPKFIILKGKEDKLLIFDKARDKFEFCVGDPDLLNFPGKKSHFIVAFSVEVNDGFLITSLPAELIDTTELKLINNYQWQPLQTYVTISKHFMVKAHGIRFRGTINDCNLVMQQLSYHGGENGAVLTLKVNDMGNYGCYSDCTDNISIPLHVKATVNLIRKRPMSSLAVHTLGSVVIIEFLMVLSFGVVLLFFTCKCAILLVNERSSFKFQNSKQSTLRNSQKESSSADLSEKTTDLTGGCSQYLSIYHRTSSFRQRSSRQFEIAESGQDIHSPSQSTRGYHLQALPDFMPLAIEKGS